MKETLLNLKQKGFYFIDDIIIKYLEIFELDIKDLEFALEQIEKILGKDYIKIIGNNLSLMEKVLQLAHLENKNGAVMK